MGFSLVIPRRCQLNARLSIVCIQLWRCPNGGMTYPLFFVIADALLFQKLPGPKNGLALSFFEKIYATLLYGDIKTHSRSGNWHVLLR